ncbi:MAG: hypothetical protein ABI813_07100 [Bacteroidota bacterium]
MDLNDIHLPAGLVADLYKNHLVESVQPGPASKSGQVLKKVLQYLGKNQQSICLLVSYTPDVYLPDEQLHFLTTILQACNLNLGDVAIINCRQQSISFAQLRSDISCKYLLLFGVEPTSIGLPPIPEFTPTTIANCSVVCAPAAEELNNSNPAARLLKGSLWTCLKQLFGV